MCLMAKILSFPRNLSRFARCTHRHNFPLFLKCNKIYHLYFQIGFCCIISMHDGVVLYNTPTITDALGFPKDMWLGRSFIDFVHPKDRDTFASQITSGVSDPFPESRNAYSKDTTNSLYVHLRQYRGLKSSGFFVKDKTVSYIPFKLVLSFREAPGDSDMSSLLAPKGTSMLLVMNAQPVVGVYKSKLFKMFICKANSNDHVRFQLLTRCCTIEARNSRQNTPQLVY